jgi:hypothetical protein
VKNYVVQFISCCWTRKWGSWDEDGCGVCLLSNIREVDMDGYDCQESFLSMDFVSSLGICDLYELEKGKDEPK